MSWYPDAIQRPVARFNPGGSKALLRTKGRGICYHVAVSLSSSLYNYFNQSGNPCSHFYVRLDGTVEQYVDTDYRAPANLEGNKTLLSIETAGGVTNAETEPWTNAQQFSLIKLSNWLIQIDNIPEQLMINSRPETKGLGWHELGVEPWIVSGGEKWSESYGKICPGNIKIEQIRTVILPGIKGDISMADFATIEAQLSDLKTMVQNLIDAEAARYGVYTGRYNVETNRWESEVARDQAENALWVAEANRDQEEAQKFEELKASIDAIPAAVVQQLSIELPEIPETTITQIVETLINKTSLHVQQTA